jgi:hypothetical protein
MKLKLLIFGLFLLNVRFLLAQGFVIPPQINIERQDTGFGPVLFDVRIWGWSNNGKVAYSTVYAWDGLGSSINFIILDLTSDNVLFELYMNSSFPDDENTRIKDEALFNLNRTSILNALQRYNIITHDLIEQQTELLHFPFRKNNLLYECHIIGIEYGKNEEGENKIIKYSVLVTANNRRKIIGNFTSSFADVINIKGYFLSPFENRAMIVIAEWSGWQHGTREYRFIGSHLDVGFE